MVSVLWFQSRFSITKIYFYWQHSIFNVVPWLLLDIESNIFRHRAGHWWRITSSGLAGGSDWNSLQPQNQAEPQESGIRCIPGLHLRVGQRCLRQGEDVGQTAQLHLPVSPGHQETDEEVRTECAPLRLHLPEPVPEVLFWPGVTAQLNIFVKTFSKS